MAPPRPSQPPDWDKDKDSFLTLKSILQLVELAGATAGGGPVGGALDLAWIIGRSEEFFSNAENWRNLLEIADKLLSILERLKNFAAESPTGKLADIAHMLGQPRAGIEFPVSAVANSAARMARGLHRPAQPNAMPPVEELYLVDATQKKNSLKAVAFQILDSDHTYPHHQMNSGEYAELKIGFVIWKRGQNFIGEKEWISTKKWISIAPHWECDSYDYWIHPAHTYTRIESMVSVPW